MSQSGSHVKWRHEDGRIAIVPFHARRQIDSGLVAKILRDAGLDPGELRR